MFAVMNTFQFSFAGEGTVNEHIIVSASRYPITFDHLCRNVEVIDAKEIAKLPVSNLQDLISYISGVDIRARGILGVQADVSIHGSSFEQVLVLVDGIRMNNGQTGHFNLNLPITLGDIERIEVLKGGGSKVFGEGTFGGVINIITMNSYKNKFSFNLNGGEYRFYDTSIAASLEFTDNFAGNLTIQKSASDGFTHNTDFDIFTYRMVSHVKTNAGMLDFSFARTNREYGANSFYSDKYPNQWEDTSTQLAAAEGNLILGGILFLPKAYWTHSDDTYLIDRYSDSSYRNESEFNRYGFECHTSFNTSLGITSAGGEYNKDQLSSLVSGEHSRDSVTFFVEQQVNIDNRLNMVFGTSFYIDSNKNSEFSPGIDVGIQLSDGCNLYMSANKSFRLPGFTELYYTDPVHKGNPLLSPEIAWTYEIGGRFDLSNLSVNLSFSRTNGKDLIDWVRSDPNAVWETRNIRDSRFDSYEISIQYPVWNTDKENDDFRIKSALTYTYGKKFSFEMESKYVFDYLKYKMITTVTFPVFDLFDSVLIFRYEERVDKNGVSLVDAGFSKDFGSIKLNLQFKNVFDVKYNDIGSVPMPGRWIFAGFCLSFMD